MLLWREVLEELGTWCCTSTDLDLKKVEARVEHEGLSFLTITLPAFAKDFEKSLELGKVDRSLFQGFKWKGGLPLFLGGFLDRVFDRGTGRLLDEPDITSIFAVRQLTLMFGKMLLPCSEEREAAAMAGYVKCEQEVRKADQELHTDAMSSFVRISALLFRDVFTKVDHDVYSGNILGKHGPGVTADRLLGNKKYDQSEWPVRLERIFPYGENAMPNWRFKYLHDRVHFLEPGAERPVKVITVPKTLKTPRIIAVEPTAMQYMQQGLMEKFVEYLETDRTVSGMIGFLDQGPNQALAKVGSSKGELATLDLSEASDRVSNQHVRSMLQRWPHLFEAVDATRSRKADVPGHGVIRLAKFASMGSALCFPMEAMVFLTLIFMGIEREHRRQLTRKDVKSYAGRVRVYGDDIIIPVDMVRSVVGCLETFGFKVNSGKSFWNGKFRESCGKEYYDGRDVSIVRVRRLLPTRRKDVPEILSAVSLRNQLFLRGFSQCVDYLDGVIEPILVHYPTVTPSSPVLGRYAYSGYDTHRMHSWHHSPLVKGYVPFSRSPIRKASGEGALLKGFLKRGYQPVADRDHLERSGRPDAVNIKLRWASPY